MATTTEDPNTVLVYVLPEGSDPPIRVEPENVPVSGQYVVINFLLQTPGWHFPGTGAVALTSSSSQFPLVSWTESDGSVVRLFDFNTDVKDYHYNLTVDPDNPEDIGNRLVVTIDPGISNGR